MPWSDTSFILAGTNSHLETSGLQTRLPAGPAQTLAKRVRQHFVTHTTGPDILVGAIPFDRMADDCLFQPTSVSNTALARPHATTPLTGPCSVTPQPTRADYENAVETALAAITASGKDNGDLSKIVLSRSLLIQSQSAIDPFALHARLGGDRGVVRFLTPLLNNDQPSYLTGATPELLIRKTGANILSHPLAGSAKRHCDPSQDHAIGQRLLQSAKDLREHRWVVEAILDGLAPYCQTLEAPNTPELVTTKSMWHLATPIRGVLKDAENVSSAELAAVLHPTPAVGGTSREAAISLIPQLEGYDRGFYAGAVGWTDRAGDGEWYVSLRCAEVSGHQARVYAGAGIVDGSVPTDEADETSAKLLAVLRAMGVDEDGLFRPATQAA